MSIAVTRHPAARLCVLLLIFLLALAPVCPAYSVLTHEEIVDLLWQQQIVPLLKARFPNATDQDLQKAHAYAYGGSVIQDIGYYPFGNELFSDLAHYVRSGDFVQALIRDSQDLNEYAFALGALAHYCSDTHGHPYVNLSVGILYPELSRQYGPAVPYDVDHKAHLATEFGFDVLQVAKGRYASEDYHNFIGFEVATPVLERAFQDTYGLPLKSVMPNEQLAINTYRRSISQIIPETTKIALLVKGDQLRQEIPNFNRQRFLYHLSKADYRKSWGGEYKQPGPGTRVLAVLVKVLPKVGPLRAVNFKEPTAKTEDLYFRSVDQTVSAYGEALHQVKTGNLDAPEIDLDTGKPTARGEYPLADITYRELLDKLAAAKFANVTPELRDSIVNFYRDFELQSLPAGVQKCILERRSQTYKELTQLRALNLSPPAARLQPLSPVSKWP
ncbi:MAG TPA: zinc dependent phospholipase C family protein [Terriglobales bacterium]|nr:zinc dependent phospholipase C family protein [Terriglobales bacterium]